MIEATCTQKFKNKRHKIVGYRIQDQQGSIKDVTPDRLKQAIRNHQIVINNLKLTSDNRIR